MTCCQGVGLGPFWWEAPLEEEGIKWVGVNSAVGAKFEESFATVKLYVVEKFGAAQQGRPHTIWSFNHTSLASLPLVTCRSIYTCCHILPGLPGVIKDQEEWLYYPIASLLLLLSSFVRTSIYKSICQLPVKSPRNFPFLVAVGSSLLTWWLLPPTMAKNPSATHRKKEATEARVGKWESWPEPRHPHWGGNKRVKK